MADGQGIGGLPADVSKTQASGGWLVELVPNATADALRRFEKLPSPPWAHAATREHLNSLEGFPENRTPAVGMVLDKQYECVEGEVFYRLRINDDAYCERGDLCVLFAAVPRGPKDGDMLCCGRIVVLGFCWWTSELDDTNRDRVRNRYEQYVRRRR